MAEIRRSPVEVGSLSHYLRGFIHPRWLFGISAINSMTLISSPRKKSLEDDGLFHIAILHHAPGVGEKKDILGSVKKSWKSWRAPFFDPPVIRSEQ